MAVELDAFNCSYRGNLLAGVDEVGRGPLVGPVVAAAVILDPKKPIAGLADSKKLSEKKREALYDEIHDKAIACCISRASVEEIDRLNILHAIDEIHDKAIACCISRASVEEIDRLNILHASMLAMKRAIESLSVRAEYVLVDGNRCPDISIPCEPVVKGDSRVECIAAASIIAKVSRDREMIELDKEFPGYGFAKHKRYPTKAHFEALERLGVNSFYRRSFKPVKSIIDRQ